MSSPAVFMKKSLSESQLLPTWNEMRLGGNNKLVEYRCKNWKFGNVTGDEFSNCLGKVSKDVMTRSDLAITTRRLDPLDNQSGTPRKGRGHEPQTQSPA